MTEETFYELSDRDIEDMKTYGEYLGYPKCCIEYFTTQFPNATDVDESIHKGTGFIPCPDCIEKIKSGQSTLAGLIKDRKHPLPFPNNTNYSDAGFMMVSELPSPLPRFVMITFDNGRVFIYDSKHNFNGLQEVLKHHAEALCFCFNHPTKQP